MDERVTTDPERRDQGWPQAPLIDEAPTLTRRNISDDVVLDATARIDR